MSGKGSDSRHSASIPDVARRRFSDEISREPAGCVKGVVTAAPVRFGLGQGDEVSEEKGGFLGRHFRRHGRSSPASSCVLRGHVSPSFAWNSLFTQWYVYVRVRVLNTHLYTCTCVHACCLYGSVCVLCTCRVYACCTVHICERPHAYQEARVCVRACVHTCASRGRSRASLTRSPDCDSWARTPGQRGSQPLVLSASPSSVTASQEGG